MHMLLHNTESRCSVTFSLHDDVKWLFGNNSSCNIMMASKTLLARDFSFSGNNISSTFGDFKRNEERRVLTFTEVQRFFSNRSSQHTSYTPHLFLHVSCLKCAF